MLGFWLWEPGVAGTAFLYNGSILQHFRMEWNCVGSGITWCNLTGVVTNWCQWPRRSLQVLCHQMCTLPLLVLCHLPFPPSCYLGILLPLLKVQHFQTGFPLLFSWENDKEEAIFYISSSHSPLHTHIFPAHFSWPHQCGWWDDGKTTQTRSGLAHKWGIFKFPMPSMVWSV